jgi:phosphopantothenoylcysteine decarboxylase/phosphopantothenate--cysteine ligase
MSTPTSKSAPFVVLGVAGGIAAYKAIEVVRQLRDASWHVAPVLTPDATRFVGAVTFSALASEPARTNLYGDQLTPIPHTYLGQSADVVVVAPATAHLIARLAIGLADDLLTATILASRAPVILCPAMHTEMWEQPSVQENLATLRRRGIIIVDPVVGPLAGGDVGAGRMVEPEEIVRVTRAVVEGWRGPLSGRHVVVTAGGTAEAIDPVRVITNRSSGRQGLAIAEVAARWGARVTLVSASPLALAPDVVRRVERIDVESVESLRTAVLGAATDADVVVMAAAVSDFTVTPAPEKIKRRDGVPELTLAPAPDVLSELVAQRRTGQVIIGFAAETANVEANALDKLTRKGVDLLVANNVAQPGAGFNHETNEVVIYDRNGGREAVPMSAKAVVAEAVLTSAIGLLK